MQWHVNHSGATTVVPPLSGATTQWRSDGLSDLSAGFSLDDGVIELLLTNDQIFRQWPRGFSCGLRVM